MIVHESTFPAVEASGIPLSHARIGYHTYTRDFDATDVTVSTETADGPRDAPLRPETHEFWQASAVPATWELDLGADFSVDYVAIAGHTCGSSGNTVAVDTENSADPGVFSEFSDDHVPTTDAPIMFLDVARDVRKLRITFSGGSAPRVGVIHVGLVMKMEHSLQPGHGPLPLSRETVLTQTLSRTGNFLGQSFGRRGVKGSASFVGLSADWYREHFDPFVQQARQYPFFFAWHPETYPAEIAYAWATEDIAPSQQLAGLVNVSLRLAGMGND